MDKKTYHYVITVQGTGLNGRSRFGTFHNTIEWDGSRSEAFDYLWGEAIEKTELDPTIGSYVSCWSFELNEL